MDAIAAASSAEPLWQADAGRISGTVFGAMVIGIISNGLNLIGVSSYWQLVCKRSDHCLRGCTGFPERKSGTFKKEEIIFYYSSAMLDPPRFLFS